MSNNTPIIDLADALNRALGDVAFLQSMLAEFQNMIPDFVERIQSAIQTGNMEQLSKEAHQFKGTAANLGAKAISTAALALEKIGKSGNPTDGAHAFQQLEAAIAAFKENLSQIDWATVSTG